jgi:hypothetical protein
MAVEHNLLLRGNHKFDVSESILLLSYSNKNKSKIKCCFYPEIIKFRQPNAWNTKLYILVHH